MMPTGEDFYFLARWMNNHWIDYLEYTKKHPNVGAATLCRYAKEQLARLPLFERVGM